MSELKDSLLLRTYRGEKGERPPVWFMRQAGRYLPEYLEVRARHTINEVIDNAELSTEVTLQPLRRFDFDGSIIFADLLTPLKGFGVEFDFIKNEGPKVFNPIVEADDVNKLTGFDLEGSVSQTLKAISMVSKEIGKEGLPLLGFSGAPFTVSSYLIEAESNPKLNKTKVFMFNNKKAWSELQEKLVSALTEYLLAQVEAGASAIQIFDSWLGGLSPEQYVEYVEPYLAKLIDNVKSKCDVPVIFFATGVSSLYPELKRLNVDAMGVDWRISLIEADKLLDSKFTLQGNLDPLLLFSSKENIEKEVMRILEEGSKLKSFVFNLGHGILPKTPIENVKLVVDLVNNYSYV